MNCGVLTLDSLILTLYCEHHLYSCSECLSIVIIVIIIIIIVIIAIIITIVM